MNPFMSLHAIAAARGDGLRPEFLRLLQARAALSDPDVIELRPGGDRGPDQAGPNPVGSLEAAPGQGVVRFPGRHGAINRAPGKGERVGGGRCESALGTDH